MERMKEIEIFGIPALFTEKRIDHDAVYPGMYRYELETVNNGPKRVSDTASGTFLGTVLTPVPIITLVTCVMNQPDYRWCVQARAKI